MGEAIQDQAITTPALGGLDQAFQGFWGVADNHGITPVTITASTSADITNITGFGYSDTLEFNPDAWGGGTAIKGSLTDAGGHLVQTQARRKTSCCS